MMRQILFILVVFLLSLASHGQTVVRVTFTDKANSRYSVDRPAEFLSQRAIERRERQGIVITEMDLPVNEAYVSLLVKEGFELRYTSRWFNCATGVFSSPMAEDILERDYIARVDTIKTEQQIKRAVNKFEPETVREPALGGVAGNYYGAAYDQLNQVNALALHEEGFRGKGMVIAVLDAGFEQVDTNAAFDSLRADGRLLGIRDFVNPDDAFYAQHYHGAKVLSIMAGLRPDIYVGSAPDASYFLIRTEDVNSEMPVEEENWVAGVELADSLGADVVNSSLGYYAFDDSRFDYSFEALDGQTTRITQAAQLAAARGMLICNSAGNERNSPWQRIVAPSDASDVLAIAAVDVSGYLASFSSAGPAADGRVKPDVAATGWGTMLINPAGNVEASNGTSYSSPLMAGVVACLWQKHRTASVPDLLEAIRQSGNRSATPDSLYGYGIPNSTSASARLAASVVDTEDMVNNEWRVYPNPGKGPLFIEFSGRGVNNSTELRVFTTLGKLVTVVPFQGPKFALAWDRELPAGVYILQLLHDGKIERHKVVRQ